MMNFRIYSMVILGAILLGLYAVAKRFFLKDKKISPLAFLAGSHLAAALMFFSLYAVCWGFSAPTLRDGFLRVVVAGFAVNIVIQFFNAKAASMDAGEVSLTAPLQAMTPGLITVVGIFLREFPGKIGWVGVVAMMAGSYSLLFDKRPQRMGDYFRPFQAFRPLIRWNRLSQSEKGRATVALLALGSAAFGTLGLLFDGLYVRRAVDNRGLTLGAGLFCLLLGGTFLLWLWARSDYGDGKANRAAFENWSGYLTAVVICGAIWVGLIYTIYPSFRYSYVAYIGTLKRFSVLVAAFLGLWLFQEQEIKRRIFASCFIVLGAVLISMDKLPDRITEKIVGFGF